MCEEPIADKDKINFLEEEVRKINPEAPIIKTVFRPEPLSDISGKKIFLAMTSNEIIATSIKRYLEDNFKCRVVKISFNLGDRKKLNEDIEINKNYYDTILTELKAASVDVLTDYAYKNNKGIIYMNNLLVVLNGENILKDKLKKLFLERKK